MRDLIVLTFLTLDGVMQAPGGPEEDPSGGFEHGGWSFGYWDVASTTRKELEWENSRLIEGDVPEGVRALKAQDGPELQVHGSANLLQTLLEDGLIDELRLWTFPVVLGKGKRLFDGGTVPAGVELVSSQVSSTGVIMATYRTGAEIKYGSFAKEDD